MSWQSSVIALLFWSAPGSAQNIFTVAGIPVTHRDHTDSQAALSAPLGAVYGLLLDNATGRLLLNDPTLVLRMEPDGSLLAVAGLGALRNPLFNAPESLVASALSLNTLRGMAQDSTGAMYLADAAAGRVYRIDLDGTVITFAGGGSQPAGFRSDGGPATAALLSSPRGLVFDSKGNLDIAEVYCNCIRQVNPQGTINTLYTLPASSLQAAAGLPNIEGLAIDAQDNLYFTEWRGNVVMRLPSDGSAATIVAGTGMPGFSGDGGSAAEAQLNGPSAVALGADGASYISDTKNNRVRKVSADGTISTIAGTGTCGFSGDGGAAANAELCLPAQIVFNRAGDLLIADYGNRRVRRILPDGTISTIAGSGQADPALSFQGSSGDGGPEIHASFNLVGGITFDTAGNLYVSESLGNVVRKISPQGVVSTFAGTGGGGYSGDEGPAVQAQLAYPGPLSMGPDGALYVISGDSRVRKVTPDGYIHLVAGTGTGSGLNRSQGDGGPAVNATLNEPGGLAFDRQGNLYIADTSNARVRKVDQNGVITTVVGPGQQGVDYYNAVAVDPQGALFVAWTHESSVPGGIAIGATVNRVNTDGSLTKVAGTGEACNGGPGQFTGDGLPALQARLCAVVWMTFGPAGQLYLAEGGYGLVLRLNADGTIERIAGNTNANSMGDAGPALLASLINGQGWSPQAVAFDPAGRLYLSEPGLNVIRMITSTPYLLTLTPNRIDVSGPASRAIAVSGNFAEPFPYAVRVSTANGGSWLRANRVTGLTGELLTINIDSTGLAPGIYRGTVAVKVSFYSSAPSQEVVILVTLTVP